MKTSILAVALLGACAGAARAQDPAPPPGKLHAGTGKRGVQDVSIGKRAAHTVGFRAAEDLGHGFKAVFHLEMLYEPTPDGGQAGPGAAQPQWFEVQRQAGLQGGFGMLRIGRGLTPFHETIGHFEPFHATPAAGSFHTGLSAAGYDAQARDPAGPPGMRWSNAIWYNSPLIHGFQLNTALASRAGNGGGAIIGRGSADAPQYPAGAEASVNPFSVSATYHNGPAALMAAYERNAAESTVWSVGASVQATPELKLMGTFARLDEGDTLPFTTDTTSWVLGASYILGPGKFLAGYGQKDSDGLEKVRQLSLGYEYIVSKRTYFYIDASRKKGLPSRPATVNQYDIGIHHKF